MGRSNHTYRHILLVPIGSQSKQKQRSWSTSIQLISYYRVFIIRRSVPSGKRWASLGLQFFLQASVAVLSATW